MSLQFIVSQLWLVEEHMVPQSTLQSTMGWKESCKRSPHGSTGCCVMLTAWSLLVETHSPASSSKTCLTPLVLPTWCVCQICKEVHVCNLHVTHACSWVSSHSWVYSKNNAHTTRPLMIALLVQSLVGKCSFALRVFYVTYCLPDMSVIRPWFQ